MPHQLSFERVPVCVCTHFLIYCSPLRYFELLISEFSFLRHSQNVIHRRLMDSFWNLNNPKESSKSLSGICIHAFFKKVYYIHQRLGWLIRKALQELVIQHLMCWPQTVLTGAVLNLFYPTLLFTVTSQAKAFTQNDWLIICLASFLKSKAFFKLDENQSYLRLGHLPQNPNNLGKTFLFVSFFSVYISLFAYRPEWITLIFISEVFSNPWVLEIKL